jgi:hypothetical protein
MSPTFPVTLKPRVTLELCEDSHPKEPNSANSPKIESALIAIVYFLSKGNKNQAGVI